MNDIDYSLKVKLAAERDALVLANQVRDWTVELRRIAALIAAANGSSCAVAMISETGEGWPELILQDALRVHQHGWPPGFTVTLLNPST